jgi:hypothetical protein
MVSRHEDDGGEKKSARPPRAMGADADLSTSAACHRHNCCYIESWTRGEVQLRRRQANQRLLPHNPTVADFHSHESVTCLFWLFTLSRETGGRRLSENKNWRQRLSCGSYGFAAGQEHRVECRQQRFASRDWLRRFPTKAEATEQHLAGE